MANRRVNVTKRVEVTVDGKKILRYCPVVRSANGRIKPDYVYVRTNGEPKEERHPEGSYHLDWMVGNKRFRENVGKDASEAYNQQQLKEQALANGSNGKGTLATEQAPESRTLGDAIQSYLAEVEITKKPKTYAAYSKALAYFKESAGDTTLLAQINRTHLINFRGFLRDEKGLSARSVYNKFESVISFLKSQNREKLVTKNDWPRFVEEEPEIYEREDIEKLFAPCTSDEKLWFQFFLMTGMREQEVMYAYWSDLNLQNHTVRVTHKPDRNWTPKAYKEREIPIPQPLVDALKTHKAKSDRKCNLIFPTAGCKAKLDFLDCLKRAAERADLNRNNFWLHKFRATFATWHLWAGVDLRTVQSWMGHSDLESTMRYLKPNRTQAVREKVNVTFGGMQ
jgi:integrase/recombinase XerD